MARPAHPWFNTSRNTWYIWIGSNKVSLGVRGKENRAEAYRVWHARLSGNAPTRERETLTVAALIESFLEDASERLKPATVRGYRLLLADFARKFRTRRADQVETHEAESYARKRTTWNSSTRHSFLGTLHVVFNWAARRKLLATNPLAGISKPPMRSRGHKALISATDRVKLLEAAPPYFKPFLQLLHLTGARPSEIAAIANDNFDAATGVVRLSEHKMSRHDGRDRIIYLTPEAVAILQRQQLKHHRGALLRGRYNWPFTKDAIVRQFSYLRRKTGVGATAYGFRHTFATEALAAGVPETHVAALLGHSGTTMLHKHYSHIGAFSDVLRGALAFRRLDTSNAEV